jgi:hypothetical protein
MNNYYSEKDIYEKTNGGRFEDKTSTFITGIMENTKRFFLVFNQTKYASYKMKLYG